MNNDNVIGIKLICKTSDNELEQTKERLLRFLDLKGLKKDLLAFIQNQNHYGTFEFVEIPIEN